MDYGFDDAGIAATGTSSRGRCWARNNNKSGVNTCFFLISTSVWTVRTPLFNFYTEISALWGSVILSKNVFFLVFLFFLKQKGKKRKRVLNQEISRRAQHQERSDFLLHDIKRHQSGSLGRNTLREWRPVDTHPTARNNFSQAQNIISFCYSSCLASPAILVPQATGIVTTTRIVGAAAYCTLRKECSGHVVALRLFLTRSSALPLTLARVVLDLINGNAGLYWHTTHIWKVELSWAKALFLWIPAWGYMSK